MSNTFVWLIFTLMAPVLWGATNVLDSAIRRRLVKDDLAVTWFMTLMRLPIALVFLVMGKSDFSNPVNTLMMFLGGLLWSLPIILYYKALEREDASRVSLLFQVQPLATLILAFLLVGEVLDFHQLTAFFLILLGGILAALKRTSGLWHFSRAFLLIIIADFLWTLSDVFFRKYEVAFVDFHSAFGVYLLGSFFFSVLMLVPAKSRRRIAGHMPHGQKRAWVLMVVSAFSSIAGSLAFAYALTLKEVALTSVIMGVQPLFVLIFGILLAKWIKEVEPESLQKGELLIKGASLSLILAGLWLLY